MRTALYLLAFLLALCRCKTEPQSLTVATAANMEDAMHEIAESFTRQTGLACQITTGSSGKLTAQIKAGAPYDVFVSADMDYPAELFRSGMTTAPPRVYAFGQLVFWTLSDTLQPSLTLLTHPKIRHVAIANPKVAPYGRAAMDALLHAGISDRVMSKLVFGESISQTNQFILTGSADIGITAKSSVLSSELDGKGRWAPVDPAAYEPIAQGAVVIKSGRKTDEARLFLDFLFSSRTGLILRSYGYRTPDNRE